MWFIYSSFRQIITIPQDIVEFCSTNPSKQKPCRRINLILIIESEKNSKGNEFVVELFRIIWLTYYYMIGPIKTNMRKESIHTAFIQILSKSLTYEIPWIRWRVIVMIEINNKACLSIQWMQQNQFNVNTDRILLHRNISSWCLHEM